MQHALILFNELYFNKILSSIPCIVSRQTTLAILKFDQIKPVIAAFTLGVHKANAGYQIFSS